MALHHRVRPEDCPPVLLKPPHNVPLDTSQDVDLNSPTEFTANTFRSAIPNTTPADEEIKNVHFIKNPEHAHPRKEVVLEGWRNEQKPSELLRAQMTSLQIRISVLEESYPVFEKSHSVLKKSHSVLKKSHSTLEKSYSTLEKSISALEQSQELDNTYFKARLAKQNIILRFETLSRILRSLNDSIVRQVRCTYSPTFRFFYGLNHIDKMLVHANGTHNKLYTNDQYEEELKRLIENSPTLLVPGKRPFRAVNLNHIRKAHPPPLYAQKLLSFLSDQELRLALQVFVLLNCSQNPFREKRNAPAHMRPSVQHAEKNVAIFSAEDAEFETTVARRIVQNNTPFLNSERTLPFGKIEDDEDLQHALVRRVEGLKSLKRPREAELTQDSGGPVQSSLKRA